MTEMLPILARGEAYAMPVFKRDQAHQSLVRMNTRKRERDCYLIWT